MLGGVVISITFRLYTLLLSLYSFAEVFTEYCGLAINCLNLYPKESSVSVNVLQIRSSEFYCISAHVCKIRDHEICTEVDSDNG